MGLYQLFASQAAEHPGAIAIVADHQQLTYQELDRRVEAIAAVIVTGQPASPIIGISASRSVDAIVGVLAIIQARKAYLPLDPTYPAERLKQIIADSGIDSCLASEAESGFFKGLGLNIIDSVKQPAPVPNPSASAEVGNAPAYVLYTSGSTGKPKGVVMGQAAIMNLLEWQKTQSASAPGFNTLQYAPLTFDVSFQEIFATLTTGGTLFLIGEETRSDPFELLQFIDRNKIHRLFLPFVALQFLAAAAEANDFSPESLKEVMTAGEQLKITPQVAEFFSALPGCKLFNQYGPTESHVVTQLELTGPPKNWPALPSIGKPIANTEILILDDTLQPVAPGEEGELYISGVCLADGYLNNPALTNERFLQWDNNGIRKRIYKSGDLARLNADGNIEYLGRADTQVKIRGNRVEPAEIEVLLGGAPGVQEAVVVAREQANGDKRLIAYLLTGTEQAVTGARHYVAEKVPDYMVPSAFVRVTHFPKTSSGKIDRKALPNPVLQRPDGVALYRAPATPLQTQMGVLWAELLQLDRVGIDDNFFDLGGNSLLVINTATQLRSQFNLAVPVTKIYQYPTISDLAEYLEEGTEHQHQRIVNHTADAGRDIAVIGMAGRWPGADTVSEFWEMLKEGKEAISFFSDEELDDSIPPEIKNNPVYVKARGVIAEPAAFDAGFFNIAPRLAELMDPQQRVFLEIAWEALEAAGHQPENYHGLIGVYAGCNNNTYYYNNVLTNPEQVAQAGAFQVMTLNEKDYIATRTAYELNLKGPAVSVYSACSTSLLAIAQAVDALRAGQCDVALAGGVTITSPVKSGHIYQEDAMLSLDGHTRTFDELASGTVFSDGAGVVLLKPLTAAQQAGDTIYAVIKGKGANNDGHNKSSFTAPSAAGQAGAINAALQDAGVSPADITYVEAHGTATPLGDPIEIDGLKLAFGPQSDNQYCAIGSVKSNMGHLTAASGVTGFIKTALCLYHKKLVPTLNFTSLNPAMELNNSSFYVNTAFKDWKSDSPRLASVSSFGVGGTNVHVVLQEAENQTNESDSGRPLQLISWSAKTESSADNYALKLSGQQFENLADVAYSLHTSRSRFNHRRFMIATDNADLKAKLQAGKFHHFNLKEKATGVVFLFPGQGSQYAGMGRELYQNEPVFKQAVDDCAAIIAGTSSLDILDVIYGDYAPDMLSKGLYIQPAIFVIEYALARLWLSWGIRPSAVLGHSLGEFAAATLAGIMDLRTALTLLMRRAEMIDKLPPGKMLAIRKPPEELSADLPEGISIAAKNSPGLVTVSGTPAAIDAFAGKLSAGGIASMMLNTSHAMHSAMVDDIIEPFEQLVANAVLSVPRLPVISSMTGKWLTDAEATSTAYWSRQMREPVEFVQALQTAHEQLNHVLLECGPGNILANLAKGQAQNKEQLILPGLAVNIGDYQSVLNSVGQFWLHGLEPHWQGFYAGQRRKCEPLPAYAFDHKDYWLQPGRLNTSPDAASLALPGTSPQTIPNQAEPAAMTRTEVIQDKIRDIFETASGIDLAALPPNVNFAEAGFDSLLLTQIALNIKKEFGVAVTFRRLYEEYNSVSHLAVYLDQTLPAGTYEPQQPAKITGNTSTNAIDAIAKQMQQLAQQVTALQNGLTLSDPASPQSETALKPGADLSPDEMAEIKKPFGATARIERQTTELTSKQQEFINDLSKRYNTRTNGSKNYTQQYRAGMADPRVVSGFRPQTKELVYPMVINRSKGSRVWDIDGNEYVDALNGFGSNFLGYNPEFLKKAFQDQIESGYEIGPQHELAGEVCSLINEFTGFERSALCNTGSEAVLGAMRMARTVTGRSLIVAFAGSYHGIIDEVIIRGSKKLRSIPAAPGIMPEAVQNMLILDYGTDESLELIKQRAGEIAAVMVEPVQSRRPEFVPVEFLKKLRKLTEDADVALIFDEVITGFRMHPGGAQAMFDIRADIGTYGKVIGGGMPVGVIAGKAKYMDALDGGSWQYGDDSVPEAGVTYFAGTFVRHPLALAGGKAVLNYLKQQGPGLQQGLNGLTADLAGKLNEICKKHKLPVYIAQFGSLWKIKFTYEMAYGELLFTLMRLKGIHIWDIFPCFLTTAHTSADVDSITKAFDESVNEMINGGFFTLKQTEAPAVTSQPAFNTPPVPGAKLGRDREGNPAWFVADSNNPGKYLQVN